MSVLGTTTILGDLTVTGDIKGNNMSGGGVSGDYLPSAGGKLTGNLEIESLSPVSLTLTPKDNVQDKGAQVVFGSTDNQHVRIRANHYDIVRAPFGLHIEKCEPNAQTGNAYLQVEGDIFANNTKKVYHEGNKPTTVDIGAARALTHTNGHWGLTHNDGSTADWIRTTANGLIPYQSGGHGSLGTSSWPFNNIYSNAYYLRGTNLENFIPIQMQDSGDVKNRLPKSGFFDHSTATVEEGYPITAPSGWMHLINCQHSNTANNYALQIAAPFHEQRFFARSTNGSGTTAWSEFTIGRASVSFGGTQTNITTAAFITLLRDMGAFHTHHWVSRGSWYYAGNQIITDTGVGNIHLAGCTIEKIGFEAAYTIKIITPNTGSSFNRAEFIYLNNGDSYSPGWRRTLMVTNVANQGGAFDNTTTAPTGTTRLNYSGYLYATRNYNAVWNDYAEYFEKQNPEDQDFEPGDVIASINDKYIKSTNAYQETVIGVYSDSFGHIVGGTGDTEKDDKECIPVGLSGRVNVKVVGKIKNGQLLTSSDIPGVAMYAKDYKPGTIIGKAVEDKTTEEIGKVKMFIMNI